MLTCVDQPDEIWTEAPIESDEDDEELVVALKDRSEQDALPGHCAVDPASS
jgi:hypothetical protein